jgi:hypothetical protein
VRAFEAVYRPELVSGPVVFTDYVLIATTEGSRNWPSRPLRARSHASPAAAFGRAGG